MFFDFHKEKCTDCDGYDLGVIFSYTTGEDDLQKIVTELSDIALALNLGIRMSAWLKIEAEHPQQVEKQKMRVLYYWLKRMEIIESKMSEDPTWARLAEAVAKIDPKIIRCKYCQNSPNRNLISIVTIK